jgi:hypothetical protein
MAMIHAENADCIEWLTKRLEAAGRTAPRFHAHARPMLVEREATHRAIALSQLVDVPILVVHVSGREAVEQIRWARDLGLQVYAETCPQYLFLTAEDLGIDDSYGGARCVCSPPPRDKANQEVIWDGLADGLFNVFSSDHAPFRYDDPEGKKPGGDEVRHTAFASVTAVPEIDDSIDIEIDENDLRVDTYRASGAGGQHVNKTDSAVRLTHLPTNIVAQCQNERSQHKNRATAMKILRAKLFERERQLKREKMAELTGEKREIGFGSQIRSYTLHPQQRAKDHRTDLEIGNVEAVLDGEIDDFIRATLLAQGAEVSARDREGARS